MRVRGGFFALIGALALIVSGAPGVAARCDRGPCRCARWGWRRRLDLARGSVGGAVRVRPLRLRHRGSDGAPGPGTVRSRVRHQSRVDQAQAELRRAVAPVGAGHRRRRAPTARPSRCSRATTTSPRTCSSAASASCCEARARRVTPRPHPLQRDPQPLVAVLHDAGGRACGCSRTSMDLRMLEYQARAMAQAIEQAEQNLRPVRMGATTVQARRATTATRRAARSPTTAARRAIRSTRTTPASSCCASTTSPAATPKPLAVWMNYGVHPESLDGYDLITGDYLGAAASASSSATSARRWCSARATSAAPSRPTTPTTRIGPTASCAPSRTRATRRPSATPGSWPTRSSRASNQIGAGTGDVPWTTDFPVAHVRRLGAGPGLAPVPGCRTAAPSRPSRATPACRSSACPTANARRRQRRQRRCRPSRA